MGYSLGSTKRFFLSFLNKVHMIWYVFVFPEKIVDRVGPTMGVTLFMHIDTIINLIDDTPVVFTFNELFEGLFHQITQSIGFLLLSIEKVGARV